LIGYGECMKGLDVTDNEKQELDRWLEWASGEVTSWPRGNTSLNLKTYEARVRKDGEPIRVHSDDRHEAIRQLRYRFNAPAVPDAPKRGMCASCPQDATEEFKVQVSEKAVLRAGVYLRGTFVATLPDGNTVWEETVPLCPRCMGVELRRFLALCMDPAEWLKIVRAGP
jgi:hypothetical protein